MKYKLKDYSGCQHARLLPRHHVGQRPAGHGGQPRQDAAQQEGRPHQEQHGQGCKTEEGK